MGEKIKWSQEKKGHGQPVPREGHVGAKKYSVKLKSETRSPTCDLAKSDGGKRKRGKGK